MKKILSFVAVIPIALALILYLFAPVIKVMGETSSVWDSITDGGDKTPMIIVTLICIIVSLIGVIIAAIMSKKIVAYIVAGVTLLTAIFCFSSKGFIVTDNEMLKEYASYFGFDINLGIGAIFAGVLLLIAAALLVVVTFLPKSEKVQAPVYTGAPSYSAPTADDRQNNLIRFFLTFFLGWIGSLVINYTSFKPRGFKSRTLAYFFLTSITFGIYGLVAAICNLTFDPAKASNIGYFRDGSEAYMPAPTQANTAQQAQADIDKQLDQMKALQDLLDKGIITQEDFNAKKKDILGL